MLQIPPPPFPIEYVCFMVNDNNSVRDLSYLCGDQRKYCSDFKTQQEAQAAFDSKMPGTQYLDGDNDGKVCEWNG